MTDITKKQYLITNKKLDRQDMQEYSLFDGVFLYVGKGQSILSCTDAKGRNYILLGNAFCTDTASKSVADDISSWQGESIDELTKYWTGRWLLITQNQLYTDACALMSAFYFSNADSFGISSSLAVISSVFDMKCDNSTLSGKLTYQLLPLTLCDKVRQLICTQKIEFAKSGISVKPRMWITDHREKSTDEKCRELAKMLENAAINMNEYSGRQLCVALTAGKDSRLSLATLLKSGVPFSAYTAEHRNISVSDRKIPSQISADFKIPYRYIKRDPLSEERRKDYFNFTSGNSMGADMEFYACGQFDKLPADSIIIRSGIFEAGQTYSRKIAGASVDSFVSGMKSYYTALNEDGKPQRAFDEWIDYISKNPCNYIDIRDRFYIEQRVCGWAAAIEQSLDMNDFVSIQIANCAQTVSLLLSCNDDERTRLALSFDTISLLKPELMEYPVNKPSFKDRVLKAGSKVKSLLRKLKNR